MNDYNVKETTLPVGNLRDTAEYEFRVFAKNKAGKGPASRTLMGIEPKAVISKWTLDFLDLKCKWYIKIRDGLFKYGKYE